MNKKLTNATKILLSLTNDFLDSGTDSLGAFLFSAGSARLLTGNLGLKERQFESAFRGLYKRGFIKRVNENQFLIAASALPIARIARIETADWSGNAWDGLWKLISFDIPETKKKERNIFRSIIKRKGFIGIQNSLFIAPYADFEELALLRRDLKIENYVSFFTAKSYKTDDDSKLREKFNLLDK